MSQILQVFLPGSGYQVIRAFALTPLGVYQNEEDEANGNQAEPGCDSKAPLPFSQEFGRFWAHYVTQTAKMQKEIHKVYNIIWNVNVSFIINLCLHLAKWILVIK